MTPSLIPMKRGLLFQIGSVRRLLINDLLAVGNLKHGSVMCAHDHILMLLICDPDGAKKYMRPDCGGVRAKIH
jgi:hypothetical protein